jgi:hypothetical protein
MVSILREDSTLELVAILFGMRAVARFGDRLDTRYIRRGRVLRRGRKARRERLHAQAGREGAAPARGANDPTYKVGSHD